MAELLITVEINYVGGKARSLVPGYTSQQDVVTTLRADLTAMGSPHPKKDAIKLHSIGRISCSWRTQEYNPIAKKLRKISKEQNAEPFHTIKEQQSILSIIVTEEPVHLDRTPDFAPYRTINYRKQMLPFQHHSEPLVWRTNDPRNANSAIAFGNPWKGPGSPASSSDQFTSSASEDQISGQAMSAPPPMVQNFLTDISDVDRLTRELRQIREQIASAKLIEKTLLDHLKRLDAPESQMEIEGPDPTSSLIARFQTAELFLQTERKRRVEAEQALRDIERECKEPFVVPALLKAFINISKLTSQS